MQPKFIHLRLHSEFSLVDGIVRIKPLVKRLAELNMPAVAVTEQGNLFSLVKFYRAAMGAGIKPIAGSDVYIYNPEDPARPFRLTLLANNKQGYVTLTELISRAYQEGQHQGVPMVQESWLLENNAGLIVLSGAMEGGIGQALLAGNQGLVRQQVQKWQSVFFNRFYLELQRVGKADEERYIHAAVNLAMETGLPVVATNDVRFLERDDFAAHEVRTCINQGRVIDDNRRPKNYTEQQYLRSAEEMQELFADIPEALENSVEIAKRCNLELTLGKNFLPDFPVPEGMTLEDVFRKASWEGLEARLQEYAPIGSGSFEENRKVYDQRLQVELDVICQMGFPGYFMIVADFIQWAKNHQIPVGPGRGSGAGSLVAYVLKITDLDPIEFDLLFERFLNPERVSMPDFDIDFCMERRDEVIAYVAQHYGREKVSQIITYGSMAAKAVTRDVGRVLGHGYGFVDRIAKLIPFEIGMTLEKALSTTPELKDLYDKDEEVKALLDMALSLEGISRNAGKHAGGVVISPTKLTDFTPLYCEQGGGNLVTQFDKDDVEAVGLVKFDFLGLRTLTIIDWALQTINAEKKKRGEELVDISQIPRDDLPSYEILKNSQTTAVFQLESRGMKELIGKLKPDCFDDIIALVALYRPGPLESGMVDDYINVKHGAKAEYAHPVLEPILQPTNGVILYQEQVMQIAREMAGYTLGGADMLRRAMGKKKPEEMAKQREIFTTGAIKNQIDESIATYVFDLMEKFAGYGFNKTVDENTKIYTLDGIKAIKDCKAGDKVLSRTPSGESVYSNVVALHDHGSVPLWEIEFDDGTIERSTLDHKWLTEKGQKPLWKIIQMGSKVWGCTAYTADNESASKGMFGLSGEEKEISLGKQMWRGATHQTRYSCAPETMLNLHEHDSYRPIVRQGTDNVLWGSHTNPQEHQRTFENLHRMPAGETGNSGADLQRAGAYAEDAGKIFRNRQKDGDTSRNTTATQQATEKLARHPSRRISGNPCQGTCFVQTFQNGNVAGTASGYTGICSQYATAVPEGAKTNRLCSSAEKNGDRSRWALAFSSHQFRGKFEKSAGPRPHVESGNSASILAINSAFDAMLQKRLWRAYFSRPEPAHQPDRRWQLGRDTVLRQPVRATFVGWHQGYDLEVDHHEHNFLLASGLCCSNSHSAAYALVAYQTAWLKAHYPAAFMAAVLSSDMDNTDKVVMLIEECRQMKLVICPPNINISNYRFTVNDKGQIVYGIGAIKGVGEAAINDLLDERRQNGAFAGLYDLCKRLTAKKVNRRVMEALIKAGTFDVFDENRAAHFAELPIALRVAEQHGKMAVTGQNDMFGFAMAEAEDSHEGDESYSTNAEPWTDRERLEGEKMTLGLYLTGHPIGQYEQELKHITHGRIAALMGDAERARGKMEARVAGLVIDIRTRQTKQGKNMGFAVLDDRTGRLEVAAFSNTYEQYRDIFVKDALLVAEGALNIDDFTGMLRLTADKMYSIEQARAAFARCLTFEWHCRDESCDTQVFISTLHEILNPFKNGDCPLVIQYFSKDATSKLQLGEQWRVNVSDELIWRLQRCSYIREVEVKYK